MDGSCLKKETIIFYYNIIKDIYICYEIKLWPFNVDIKFKLLTYLFGAVRSSKTADPNRSFSSGYRIGYHAREVFSLSTGDGFRKNTIRFGVDNKSITLFATVIGAIGAAVGITSTSLSLVFSISKRIAEKTL